MCQHLPQLDDDIPTADDEVPTPSTDDDDDAQAQLQPMKKHQLGTMHRDRLQYTMLLLLAIAPNWK